jgi:hypothetical protein
VAHPEVHHIAGVCRWCGNRCEADEWYCSDKCKRADEHQTSCADVSLDAAATDARESPERACEKCGRRLDAEADLDGRVLAGWIVAQFDGDPIAAYVLCRRLARRDESLAALARAVSSLVVRLRAGPDCVTRQAIHKRLAKAAAEQPELARWLAPRGAV